MLKFGTCEHSPSMIYDRLSPFDKAKVIFTTSAFDAVMNMPSRIALEAYALQWPLPQGV